MLFHPRFQKDLEKLPPAFRALTLQKLQVFQKSPLHPSLRLHPLRGKLVGIWSLSITKNIRVLFESTDSGDVILLSVGHHDIYKHF